MKEDNIEQQHTEETPEKNRVIAWVKEHKSQLLLAGVSITTVFLTVMGIKNKDALTDLWKSSDTCFNTKYADLKIICHSSSSGVQHNSCLHPIQASTG